jgi:DNA replication and repair protein RecF
MHIDSLRLWNFKNLHGQIEFSEGINLLVAANGFGKSNLLEAIGYLASGSSFRRVPDELIWPQAKDSELSLIAGTVGSDVLQLEWHRRLLATGQLSARKKFQFNSKAASIVKFRQYIGALVYAPTSIDLVTGQAKQRRDFLDEVLISLQPSLYQVFRDYRRVVLSRNSLLQNVVTANQLEFWNDKLAQLGSQIIAERLALLSALLPILEDLSAEIYNLQDFKVSFSYVSKVSGPLSDRQIEPGLNAAGLLPTITQSFKSKLEAGSGKELQAGRGLYGPHLDDIEFFLQGRLVRFGASRGQQRLFGLILHLAALNLIEAEKGDKQILLLDDLFSELDPAHRQNTASYITKLAIGGQQVFITAPASDYIPKKIVKIGNKLDLAAIRDKLA